MSTMRRPQGFLSGRLSGVGAKEPLWLPIGDQGRLVSERLWPPTGDQGAACKARKSWNMTKIPNLIDKDLAQCYIKINYITRRGSGKKEDET